MMLLLFFTTHFIDSTQASNFFFSLGFLQEFDSSSTENYIDNKKERKWEALSANKRKEREKNDKGLKWVLFVGLERNEKWVGDVWFVYHQRVYLCVVVCWLHALGFGFCCCSCFWIDENEWGEDEEESEFVWDKTKEVKGNMEWEWWGCLFVNCSTSNTTVMTVQLLCWSVEKEGREDK